jgi:hypothetical protein
MAVMDWITALLLAVIVFMVGILIGMARDDYPDQRSHGCLAMPDSARGCLA